ncbi:hypothetical protein DRQ12_10985 [candidate division KSB1 bacterium]|nr:MAG: hypothetical protein DRQ12_10985 [candidate division KSB1 bacterium]
MRIFAVILFALLNISLSVAQIPQHKYPRTSVQQSWVEIEQPSVLEVLAKFDLIQAPLTPEQIQKVRQMNPNAMILPFDSMGELRDKVPSEWDTGENYTRTRAFQNVSDNCPVYHGAGSYRGVPFDGRNFQDWKAEVSVSWREKGFDGCYLDLWYNTLPWKSTALSVSEYQQGMIHLAEKMRNLWPQGIFVVNSASSLKHSFALNGFMYEDLPNFVWPFSDIFETIDLWERKGAKPTIIILNQRSFGDEVVEDKNDPEHIVADFWKRGRFAITLSMLWDCTYVMYNLGRGGSPHWASPWWFDEFDVNIGTPLGKYFEISPRVYARKFTNGIVICNASASPVTITADDLGPETYYRFRGGQQPRFNNGARFTSVVLDGYPARGDPNIPMGDGIILVKTPQVVVADIIIDDEGYDPSSYWGKQSSNIGSKFVQEGMLFDPESYGKWADSWRIHGHNTCYYAPPGDGSRYARWIPTVGVPGEYEVFEWHPASYEFAINAPFVIKHAEGETKIKVDQTKNGGQWNSLGVYKFLTGTTGYVELTNKANGVVVADAIKFVYLGGGSNLDTTPPSPPKGVKVKQP